MRSDLETALLPGSCYLDDDSVSGQGRLMTLGELLTDYSHTEHDSSSANNVFLPSCGRAVSWSYSLPESVAENPFHYACFSDDPRPLLLQGRASDIHRRNHAGQTPLHILLLRLSRMKACVLLESLDQLLSLGADVSARDREGNTPLLYLRSHLGPADIETTVEVARRLLSAGSDPNAHNDDHRTLLSHSIYQLDAAASLTRLLLNHGACVWSKCENSAFSWFLQAVVRNRRLVNCHKTLALLGHVMAQNPRLMHHHVLTMMFYHGKFYKVLGPVFYQIKMRLMKSWKEPPSLKYSCWRSIRQSLNTANVESSVPKLGLPKPLQKYILME